jgi:hypothetical protein
MRKILVLFLSIMPLFANAQNFNEDGGKYEVYCKVVKGLKVSININDETYNIVDKGGEKIKTNDEIEVLNLLSKRGWRLVSSSQPGTATVQIFIMKKEITDDKEILIGLENK